MFEKKQKTMTTFNIFFDGFAAKKGDDNYRSLFQWFCQKTVTAVMSSPSSMVVVALVL